MFQFFYIFAAMLSHTIFYIQVSLWTNVFCYVEHSAVPLGHQSLFLSLAWLTIMVIIYHFFSIGGLNTKSHPLVGKKSGGQEGISQTWKRTFPPPPAPPRPCNECFLWLIFRTEDSMMRSTSSLDTRQNHYCACLSGAVMVRLSVWPKQ